MRNLLKPMLIASLSLAPLASDAQDRYWPLDGNKRITTYSASVSTYGGVSVPTDFFPTVYSTNAEVLFSMANGGLTFPYDNVPNRVNLDGYGAKQAFPIPGACKKYGILDVYYVPTPHGHAVTYRTVDASAVVNNINTTPLPTVTIPTGIFGGASGASGQYGAVAARLNNDGTRYIYHLNFGTTLSRYTVSYTGTIGSATTITTSLPNVTGRMNISGDGKSMAFINTSNQLVTYDLASSTSYTYTGVTFSSGNNKCMQQVTHNGERRWYVSTGTALGYVVEGSSSFYTISTQYGTKSSLALGQNGKIYFAQGTPGTTPGYIYYFDPGTTSIYFSLLTGQVEGATYVTNATNSTVQNGAYYFGNHVEGEDISSFPTAPITIAFNINGRYVAPPDTITAYNCLPLVMRRSTDHYNYQIRIKTVGGSPVTVYNSGFRQGRLPDSLDLRNLCSIGGTGNCSYLTGKTGQYDIEVTYAGACSGTTTTTIRVNLIQGVSDLDLEVNGQTGTPDILLCDGDTDLELETNPTGNLTGYRIILEKGDTLAGGAFDPDGLAYQSAKVTATSIPVINLRTYTSYLNGYSGFVRATVRAFTPCDSVSSSQVFHLTQGNKISSTAFLLNDMIQSTPTSIPPVIWICTDSMSLILKPGVVTGLIDSYSIRIDKGMWLTSTNEFIDTGSSLQYQARIDSTVNTIELYDDTMTHKFLGDTSGHMKFTLNLYGPCGDTSVSQVFNIQFATLDFKMNCPSCFPVGTGSPRQDTSLIGAWNGDIKEAGWQGNASAGIAGLVYSDTSIIDTTFIVVDKVDDTGAVIQADIVNAGFKLLNSNAYQFNAYSNPPAYFFTTAVPEVDIFRVTVTSVTTTCGTISNVSYFKIAPIAWGKPSMVTDENPLMTITVFPNPASNMLLFKWENGKHTEKEAIVEIMDIQGRVIITQKPNAQSGVTRCQIDVSNLTSGVYLYRIMRNGINVLNGKFDKL